MSCDLVLLPESLLLLLYPNQPLSDDRQNKSVTTDMTGLRGTQRLVKALWRYTLTHRNRITKANCTSLTTVTVTVTVTVTAYQEWIRVLRGTFWDFRQPPAVSICIY